MGSPNGSLSAWIGVVAIGWVSSAAAQDGADSRNQDKYLERRVEDVERMNEKMKRRLDDLEEKSTSTDSNASEKESQVSGLGIAFHYGEVQTTFQIFGEYGFHARHIFIS
ncbi:MAG: hypothetical protein HYR85_14150 [Planctomycetes bacterium]|nr:hypothetical protein [Planctomycetota bacterium]MBI3845131.1 hypothetical protein [Planctomycetota bacterium]